MHITLENVSIYIAIVSFAVGLVKIIIIAPLQKDNKALQHESKQQVEMLRKEIDQLRVSIERLDPRSGSQRRAGLVEGDVAIRAYA